MVEAGLGVGIPPAMAAGMLTDTLTPVPLRPRQERGLLPTGPTARPWYPDAVALRDLCAEHISGGGAPGGSASGARSR
ncbi:hypothetical protein GCM10018793_58530 [Streptomyces sulfonofaciens]|uniref:LysR substrate-binding domain-containing protein n=1 Tax=Streptomyces sulfonofaciens TaxID=68272 RepID=A0A919GKR7_9ACTN|nr:hypothetical protein [Streptomyces sulfonofaciens]GHH86479.1 hypothetical protein GCM10018793_58530 [Streptomyces sulfonofaciens]